MDGVADQGAAALDAAASVLDAADEKDIARLIDAIPDPAGTFYRFSLAESMLRRSADGGEEKK